MENIEEITHGTVFRQNLQRYMDANGMSHNGTAKAAGVSQKTVWSVCSGRSVPTLNTAQRVAKAVGVDAAVLKIKPLSPSQVARSTQVARLASELIELSAGDLKTVRDFVAVLRKPGKGQLELIPECESDGDD